MSFAQVGFLDVFELAGSLRQRLGAFDAEEPRALRVRALRRGSEDEFAWLPVFGKGKWPELGNLLGRLKRDGGRILGGEVEFGHVWLELLDTGLALPWQTEAGGYFEQYARLHLAVRTNPQAMIYCGAAAMHLVPGSLVLVNPRLPCSAVNLGEHGRIHLVIDVRKKEAVES